jgi:LysR family glycine cleavage system transcriptional activator
VLLFERVRQRVILSDAGQKFLPEVRRLLNQTEELMVRAMASARADSTLSIASLPTFGSRWLVPRLPDFLKRHPDTVINIASRSAPFDFEEQNFDLAIHYGQPVWARATCSYLCSEIIVPAASPAMLATHPVASPEDIVTGPMLHLATRPKLWAQWFEANDMDGRGAYRGNRFDQFSMVIEAATAGLGFALLPRYLIEQEIAAGTLQIVLDRPMQTENSYYLAVPEGKLENPISLAFREWITEQVG